MAAAATTLQQIGLSARGRTRADHVYGLGLRSIGWMAATGSGGKLGGFAGGEYLEVTQCAHDQSVWLIGFEISYVKDKELPKLQRLYLQVRDLGDHRYQMESALSDRPASCKADPGNASDQYPWLSGEEIRKLK